MHTRRRLTRLAASLALAAGASLAVPAVAEAAVPVGGGAPLVFGGISLCTTGAAGYDTSGAPVLFTAAHCTTEIGEPVTLRDNAEAGVIGTVAARNEVLDYAVVSLHPGRAFPVGQPGVTGRGPVPGEGTVVCKDGATTGHTCGITWQVKDGLIWNQACAGHGDSGGPVTVGGRLVGLVGGGGVPPALGSVGSLIPATSCVNPLLTPFYLPGFARSFDQVVADATARGWPGAGFRMA